MNAALLNLVERAGWTFLQTLGGTIAATATLQAFDWQVALITALGATALSVMKTLSVQATLAATPAPPAAVPVSVVASVPAEQVPMAFADTLGPRHAAPRPGPSPVPGASVAGISATGPLPRSRP